MQVGPQISTAQICKQTWLMRAAILHFQPLSFTLSIRVSVLLHHTSAISEELMRWPLSRKEAFGCNSVCNPATVPVALKLCHCHSEQHTNNRDCTLYVGHLHHHHLGDYSYQQPGRTCRMTATLLGTYSGSYSVSESVSRAHVARNLSRGLPDCSCNDIRKP